MTAPSVSLLPAKPAALAPRFETIPPELTALPRWVLWRWEQREGKWTKPPLQASGAAASSTGPATWTSFDSAVTAYRRGGFDGVGFVLEADLGIVALDLDHVRDPDTGALHPEAQRIVNEINSYTEVSPSGCGLRILARGTLPPGWRNTHKFLVPGIEVYDRGRYVTLTGHHLEGVPR